MFKPFNRHALGTGIDSHRCSSVGQHTVVQMELYQAITGLAIATLTNILRKRIWAVGKNVAVTAASFNKNLTAFNKRHTTGSNISHLKNLKFLLSRSSSNKKNPATASWTVSVTWLPVE